MSEEENTNVETEVVEEVVQPEESDDSQQQPEETQQQRQQRNDAEYNWAEARRQKREVERENQELRSQLDSFKKKALPPEEDEFSNLAKDDFLTVEQADRRAEKRARQVVEAAFRERDASTVDERLRAKFPDYESTLTTENIELLNELKPDVAESLTKHKDDPYLQAKLAYEYIKAFVPLRDEAMNRDRKKAEVNSKKPVSVQAVAKQSPIAQSHLFEDGPLTQERKNAIYKQMLQDMKGY